MRSGAFVERYDGNQYKTGNHGEGSAVDGGLKNCGERGTEQQVEYHYACAQNVADPYGGLRSALHVKTKEEGGQKCACKRAPAYTHELSYKGNVTLVLDYGDNGRNNDEYHYQCAQYKQLLFLAEIFHNMVFDKVKGEGGAGSYNEA